ncbi:carbohydrate porin [Beijerinckia sp. L45]|uniref:carbohydrate porin n=1 Tax=Beijerinckia sp. L45 TaxID=1641855 RepID=UPI00131DA8F2|nr:carbohydrate porin [Beijerinckia sp. L45]
MIDCRPKTDDVNRPRAYLSVSLLLLLSTTAALPSSEATAADMQAATPPLPPTFTATDGFAPLKSIGTALVADGIYPHAFVTTEFSANPAGGRTQGADITYQLYAGFDIDLEKLAGIKGAGLHINFSDRAGRALENDHLGSSFGTQEVFGGQVARLAELTWDQALFDDRVEVRAGRFTELSGSVFGADVPAYCTFVGDHICGAPYIHGYDSSDPVFPAATWGGYTQLNITKQIYARVGLSEEDRAQAENGFDLSGSKATGVFIPTEVGYRTTGAFPVWYRVTFAHSTSFYSDPFFDANGKSALATGNAPRKDRGRDQILAAVDQKIWNPDNDPTRGITAIAGADFGLQSSLDIGRQLFIGFVDNGPFKSRPNDTVSFLVNDLHMGSNLTNYLNQAGFAMGARQTVNTDQISLELNYGYDLGHGVQIKPNLQYGLHPVQLFAASTTRVPDYFALGVELNMDLDVMTGIPERFYSH